MAIEKYSGQECGATLRFYHQGPAMHVWIGFGLGPGHADPVKLGANRWIGSWSDIGADATQVTLEVDVSGFYPNDLPRDTKVDCIKVIAPSEPPFTPEAYEAKYHDDWDDGIYVTIVGKWDIQTPSSEYF